MITILKNCVRISVPIVWITTTEEARVRGDILAAWKDPSVMPVVFWDCVEGTGASNDPDDVVDPNTLIRQFTKGPRQGILVLGDFHRWLANPGTARLLKNHALASREETKVIIIIAPPSAEIPAEIQSYVYPIEWAVPDAAELRAAITTEVESTVALWRSQGPKAQRFAEELSGDLQEERLSALVDACTGMTLVQAQRALGFSLTIEKKLNPKRICGYKAEAVRQAGLDWRGADVLRGFETVGGLDELKDWARARGPLFTAAAREWGVPPPRGVFLAGVPGGGKSQIASAIAGEWGLPLIRLDMGAQKSKFVGDSEANIRRALQIISALAPCVCFIDEIDKALGGSSGEQGDGGVASDALGTLLTWMQERKEAVFTVATANNVAILPAELLRAGRFDAVFYVDLPSVLERRAILEVQWKMTARYYRDPAPDFNTVAAITDEFSGAELREVIQCGLISAFNDCGRSPVAGDFEKAARAIRPLASVSDKVGKMREWGKKNARPASR